MVFSYGGGDGSRTHVQKSIRIGVSERRRLFTFPYADVRRQTSALGSSQAVTGAGAHPCSRSPLKRHPYRTAVLPGRMSSLNQAAKATLLLSVNFVCGFYSGSAPLLASDTSKSLSKPLRPRIYNTPKRRYYLFCSFSALSIALAASRFAAVSRLSCSFLPLQSPNCTLTSEPLK